MADDQLRMQATVLDGFTSPLTNLRNQLSGIGNHPGAKAMAKDWQGLTSGIQKATAELRTGFQPVLSTLGVSSLGIGSALAGATMAMKTFAFSTRDMSMFSRQIGMSVGQLKEVKAIGERFGIGWDQAQGNLKQFAGSLDQLRRRYGEVYGQLRAQNLGGLVEEMIAAPNISGAFEKLMETVRGLKDPVRAREVMQIVLGSDQWATAARELTPKMRAEIKKMMSEITPEMEKASEAFVENWFNMEKAVEKFTTKAIGPLLQPMTEMMAILGKPVGEELTGTLTKLQNLFGNFGEIWKGLKSGSIKENLDALGKLDRLTDMDMGRGPDGLIGANEKIADLKDRIAKADALKGGTADRLGLVDNSVGDRLRAELKTVEADKLKIEKGLREGLEKLAEEMRKTREGGGATVQQQSFNGGSGFDGAKILNASLGSGGFGLPRMGVSGSFGGGNAGGGHPGRGRGGGAGSGEAPPPVAGDGPGVSGPIAPFTKGGSPEGRKGGRGYANFDKKSPQIMSRLMADFGLSREQAAGIVGNLGHESGAFNHHQEVNPVGGGRGGAGWAQWTDTKGSPRRTNFGNWAQRNSLDPKSDEASYGFLTRADPEFARALAAVKREKTTQGAMVAFEKTFERAGVKAYGSRMGFANRALALPERQEATGQFPAVRSLNDWSDASGAAPTPYPPGWNAGANRAAVGRSGDGTPMTGRGTGDSMMGRAFGPAGIVSPAPKLDATGTVNVHLTGGLEKMPARVSMDGLFRDVKVNRGRQTAGDMNV